MSRITQALTAARAPAHILAALEALQHQNASADRLAQLTGPERSRLWEWCDARQVTLVLPYVCGARLPEWVSERVAEKAARYALRFDRLKRDLFEVVDALNAARLEFVMLKGLSHAPALSSDAQIRAQGDIDLWLRGPSVYAAREVLQRLGYRPLLKSKSRHLAPMARPSNWRWRGDLFDAEMPVSVELHYELWSEPAEYIAAPDLQMFWERRKVREFDGRLIHVLADEDLIGFSALHLLLHLLHGELPLQRAWEIARFLNLHCDDYAFWASWRRAHPTELRQLETVVFYLTSHWFRSRSREEDRADFQELPAKTREWLECHWLSPLTREWEPNKLETSLHMTLINRRKRRCFLLLRRLIPMTLPSFADRTPSRTSLRSKLQKIFRQRRLIIQRLHYHLVTFVPTVLNGVRWL